MKIYTRGGDKGATQVYMGKPIRVTKNDAIIEVYGTLDELNANLGLLAALLAEKQSDTAAIEAIQRAIFETGYALSASSKLTQQDVDWLEKDIDNMTQQLAPQTAFILPGGSQQASQAHVCRTICRRAERRLVELSQAHEVSELAMAYVNRLSDWLFVFARF